MTAVLEVADWRERAAALADQLADAGDVCDPRWRAAVRDTPRHVFVPRFHRGADTVVDSADPDDHDAWLAEVYRDTTLVTQFATIPGTDLAWSTSSSTRPGLMTHMLDLLDADDTTSVLEIGTATGYNAALLCCGLGADRVASIELHPALAAAAAERLHALGHRPTLAVGDGVHGIPRAGPFDRVLATCAISAVPPAWIAQLAPDGRIVADLGTALHSNLTVLRKTGPDTVHGRLLSRPGHFMRLRPLPENPLADGGRWDLVIDVDDAETTTTDLDLDLLTQPGVLLLLGLAEPGLRSPSRTRRGDSILLSLRHDDGSWADRTGATVVQGGPRRLWPAVEQAVATWLDLGRPEPDRFGITATTHGEQTYWIDHTTNVVPRGA